MYFVCTGTQWNFHYAYASLPLIITFWMIYSASLVWNILFSLSSNSYFLILPLLLECVCGCACVCLCVWVWVRTCACVCVCAHLCVCVWEGFLISIFHIFHYMPPHLLSWASGISKFLRVFSFIFFPKFC